MTDWDEIDDDLILGDAEEEERITGNRYRGSSGCAGGGCLIPVLVVIAVVLFFILR